VSSSRAETGLFRLTAGRRQAVLAGISMGELHRRPKNLKRSILIRSVGTPAAVIGLMTAVAEGS
jgi:hypothetical protein